jgi:hypothetical protein
VTGAIDPRKRKQLLPASWQPWQKPRPALPIDEWVAQQKFAHGILPSHIEHDGCPFRYARQGIVTAVHLADEQDLQRSGYIRDRLEKYATEADAIATAAKALGERISGFWQTHLGIDGYLYRFDHLKVADIQPQPEISQDDVLGFLQQLAAIPEKLKLVEIRDNATAARQIWINNQGDVWKSRFVAHLGLVWQDMIRKPPTNSDPFKGFVTAAWDTIAPKRPSESFDRAVRSITAGFRAADAP